MSDRLTKRQFQSLLKRAAKIAAVRADVQDQLSAAFNERYGATYSDVDADSLIDILDYHGGTVPTVDECDAIMENCGAPRLTAKDRDR